MEKILPSPLSLKYERKYFIDIIKRILLFGKVLTALFKKWLIIYNTEN